MNRVGPGTPAGGQFAPHSRSDDGVSLSSAPWPLTDADIDFATGGGCGLVAARLAPMTGGTVVIYTVDGDGWTHAAVRLPDGSVIDAKGVSDGSHILNDDVYYFALEEKERDDAEPYLGDADVEDVDWKAGQTPDDARLADRIAAQLAAWLNGPQNRTVTTGVRP